MLINQLTNTLSIVNKLIIGKQTTEKFFKQQNILNRSSTPKINTDGK